MSSATDTLEAVAKLLPADRRERFLSMMARFRNVPEDDEYLQVLEAIGFMTLLWKEVPDEVNSILKGASPVPENSESLAAKISETIIGAIPSYEDFRKMTVRLEKHELALRNLLREQGKKRIQSGSWNEAAGHLLAALAVGMVAGLALHDTLLLLLP